MTGWVSQATSPTLPGLPDPCDDDDDGDGVKDAEDPDPVNALRCGDGDRDTCDDCSGGTVDIFAYGLDSDGDVLGDAGDPTPVPEPSPPALTLAAILTLLTLRRIRRDRRACGRGRSRSSRG